MCVKIEFYPWSLRRKGGQGASFGEEAPLSQPITIDVSNRPYIYNVGPQSGAVHSGTTVTIVGANFALKGVRVKKADNHLERLRYYHHPQSTQVLKQHGRSLGDY